MALQTAENKSSAAARKKTTAARNELPKADGWLNLSVVASDGTEYRLSSGIPLHVDKRLERSLINKAKEQPDMKFTLVGVVKIVEEEPADDIAL